MRFNEMVVSDNGQCGDILVWQKWCCVIHVFHVLLWHVLTSRWWQRMMWWPLGVVGSKIGFSCRTHQVFRDIFFLTVSFSYHIISYNIQSETYSLVTRTPPFAAPKSSVAEVDPVMLSSLPDKRYQQYGWTDGCSTVVYGRECMDGSPGRVRYSYVVVTAGQQVSADNYYLLSI